MKTATYFLPEHLLCYFHYDDSEGLDDSDIERLDRFHADMVKRHGSFVILSNDEETRDFVSYHNLTSYGWQTDSCVAMTFAVEKNEGDYS